MAKNNPKQRNSGNNKSTPSLSALIKTPTSSMFAGAYSTTWRGEGPAGDEDSFYIPVYNYFDPRQQARGSSILLNEDFFDLEQYSENVLERKFAASNSNYPVPDRPVIQAMMDSICDISRLYGMYLTFLSSESTLDVHLVERNRDFGFIRNRRAMANVLSRLPLPPFLKTMIAYYNRFTNISSGSPTYVGFLTVGDYDAFQELYDTVRSGSAERRQAFTELLRIYPEIGNITYTPPKQTEGESIVEAFINAPPKFVTNSRQCRYTHVHGSSPDQQALFGAGWLSNVFDDAQSPDLELYSLSRFAAPGSGNGGDAAQTSNFPGICRYDDSAQKDSMLYNANNTYNVGTAITFQTTSETALLDMFAIQHNMESDLTNGIYLAAGQIIATGEAAAVTARPVGGIPWPQGARKVAGGHSIGTNTFKEDANAIHLINLCLGNNAK